MALNSSGGEATVLKLWRMLTTPLLPLLPDPLSQGMVVTVRFPSLGLVDQFKIH